jgi:hypothetical protein
MFQPVYQQPQELLLPQGSSLPQQVYVQTLPQGFAPSQQMITTPQGTIYFQPAPQHPYQQVAGVAPQAVYTATAQGVAQQAPSQQQQQQPTYGIVQPQGASYNTLAVPAPGYLPQQSATLIPQQPVQVQSHRSYSSNGGYGSESPDNDGHYRRKYRAHSPSYSRSSRHSSRYQGEYEHHRGRHRSPRLKESASKRTFSQFSNDVNESTDEPMKAKRSRTFDCAICASRGNHKNSFSSQESLDKHIQQHHDSTWATVDQKRADVYYHHQPADDSDYSPHKRRKIMY